jgi:hypothetical protein
MPIVPPRTPRLIQPTRAVHTTQPVDLEAAASTSIAASRIFGPYSHGAFSGPVSVATSGGVATPVTLASLTAIGCRTRATARRLEGRRPARAIFEG